MSRAQDRPKRSRPKPDEPKVRVDASSRGSRSGPRMGIGARRRDRAARGPLHLLRVRVTVRIRVGVRVGVGVRVRLGLGLELGLR